MSINLLELKKTNKNKNSIQAVNIASCPGRDNKKEKRKGEERRERGKQTVAFEVSQCGA